MSTHYECGRRGWTDNDGLIVMLGARSGENL